MGFFSEEFLSWLDQHADEISVVEPTQPLRLARQSIDN